MALSGHIYIIGELELHISTSPRVTNTSRFELEL
jgi:hypothetical protein